MFDLHCHSIHSDGLLTPSELIIRAKQNALAVLALTDHDTVSGLKDLHQAAKGSGIRIINGIELSSSWKKYEIHIIGLNIEPDSLSLLAQIQAQQERRIFRGKKISERLSSLKIVENAYEKACTVAGHERVGRPHFAQVLVDEAVVQTKKAAFERFLGRGRLAYEPSPWPDVEEVVTIINESGGQAVLAHPHKYKLTRTKLVELIKFFKSVGGSGMEVISGSTLPTQWALLAGLSMRYELSASTGSDFHGPGLSSIELGGQPPLPLNCIPIWKQWKI